MASEKPILFSGPMVRAILEGRKSMTRRVVKQVPHWDHCGRDIMEWGLSGCYTDMEDRHWLDVQTDVDDNIHKEIFCPYGRVGDRLWVCEAFSAWFGGYHWYDASEFRERSSCTNLFYRATHHMPDDDQRWTPSIHMPRWASRITLEITGVRVERLLGITEEDAMAEGLENTRHTDNWWQGYRLLNGHMIHQSAPGNEPPTWMIDPKPMDPLTLGWTAVENFRALWESLNAKRGFGWDVNPWCWVVSFKRVEATQ